SDVGDRTQGAHAGLRLALLETHTDPERGTIARLYSEGKRAIPIFEQAEDHAGLAQAWHLTGVGLRAEENPRRAAEPQPSVLAVAPGRKQRAPELPGAAVLRREHE